MSPTYKEYTPNHEHLDVNFGFHDIDGDGIWEVIVEFDNSHYLFEVYTYQSEQLIYLGKGSKTYLMPRDGAEGLYYLPNSNYNGLASVFYNADYNSVQYFYLHNDELACIHRLAWAEFVPGSNNNSRYQFPESIGFRSLISWKRLVPG